MYSTSWSSRTLKHDEKKPCICYNTTLGRTRVIVTFIEFFTRQLKNITKFDSLELSTKF